MCPLDGDASVAPVDVRGPIPTPGPTPLLQLDRLAIAYRRPGAPPLQVVDSATLELWAGSAVGIAGESGSGKTTLCRAIIGTLHRRDAFITGGQLRFDGQDLTAGSEARWRSVRGSRIAYIPQSSLAGLNPVLSVATHLRETLVRDGIRGRAELERRSVELLDTVRIARPGLVLGLRPHQLSGGMRQRVMIALALARRPRLLVADEPTTALDVSIQREIIKLLTSVRTEFGLSLLLITHDVAVLEAMCDELVVMYAGATIEAGPLTSVVDRPVHPYTRALVESRIDLAVPGTRIPSIGGDPSSPGAWAPGCRFAPRCPDVETQCLGGGQPPLVEVIDGRRSACLLAARFAATS
jgi:oligopeptide/dipeptide ABC transporter ATP-binding protein